MIDPVHLLEHIIRPVLKDLELHSAAAERLVLGTACKESECGRWLVQLGNGPARGIYQMEPATFNDLFSNYLDNRPELRSRVLRWSWCSEFGTSLFGPYELIGNLYFATAMCRVHYRRIAEAIPESLPEQAAYWKKYYNTELGAGTVNEYISAWYRFVPSGVV